MHTAKGMVPIESIKEGDMVATRYEGEDPSVTHFRRVDKVRKRLVLVQELVVFRMHDEDIWVTPDHLFFEIGNRSWISAVNVTTSNFLQGLNRKVVKLKHHPKTPQQPASSKEASVIAVYDLSVHEYDRYAVGKDGLLVSSCSDVKDLENRDRQVWGERWNSMVKVSPSDKEDPSSDKDFDLLPIVIGGVLGVLCLILLIILMVRKYRKRGSYGVQESLLPKD